MGWTAGVCCAAIACALLEQMHPSGVMQKTAQCVLALFFLAVLVLPLPQIEWPSGAESLQTSETADRADALTALMRRQMVQSVSDTVEQTVRDRLKAAGVVPVRVSVSLTTDGDAVCPDGLTIVLRGTDRLYENTVRIRMRDMLGIEPDIRYDTGGGDTG